MDNNNQQTGQQGYGQNEDPTRAQPREQERNAQPLGGNDSNSGSGTTMTSGSSTGDVAATGQASYGNSGETDTMQGEMAGQDRQNDGQSTGSSPDAGFIGSGETGNDMGSSGSDMQQQGGFEAGQSDMSSAGSLAQDGELDQDFASQGQGALARDMMGDGEEREDQGTDDIEIERRQSSSNNSDRDSN